jgi:hypothetical protein
MGDVDGNGLTVTTTVTGFPLSEFAVGVIVYVTVAGTPVVLVSVWAISGPFPSENPVAVPLVRVAVQVKVVFPKLLDNEILVAEPLQIASDEGVAVTTGISFTVTTTCTGSPVHPWAFLSTTDKV